MASSSSARDDDSNVAEGGERAAGPVARLLAAAHANRADEVARLLDEGAAALSASSPAAGGVTALHRAAEGGGEEAARALLDRGAAADAWDDAGARPLHYAAANGHVGVARLLLDRGAAPHVYADVPYGAAGAERARLVAKVRQCDRRGALVGRRSVWSQTALGEAVAGGHVEMVRLLVLRVVRLRDFSASMLERDLDSEPAKAWRPEIVALLRTRGRAAETLLVAAERGLAEDVRRLLAGGADPAEKWKLGGTALHAAASSGSGETVRVLLEAGFDAEAANWNRKTPAMVAAAEGRVEALRALFDGGASAHGTMPGAVYSRCIETVRLCIERGEPPGILSLAAGQGDAAMVQFLLDAGAPLVKENNEEEGNALANAACDNHVGVMRLLLRYGAPGLGHALDNSAQNGHAEGVQLLLEAGAPLSGRPGSSYAPLAVALGGKHYEAAALLLAREPEEPGAAKRLRDALEMAARHLHIDITRRLLDDPVVAGPGGEFYGGADTPVAAAMLAAVGSNFNDYEQWAEMVYMLAARGGRVPLRRALQAWAEGREGAERAVVLLSSGACEASEAAGLGAHEVENATGLDAARQWAAGRHPLQAERRAVAAGVAAHLPAVLARNVADFVHVVRERGGEVECGSCGDGGVAAKRRRRDAA